MMQMDLVGRNDQQGSHSAQPFMPQLNRLRWEQEWLAQNNGVVDVVTVGQSKQQQEDAPNTAMMRTLIDKPASIDMQLRSQDVDHRMTPDLKASAISTASLRPTGTVVQQDIYPSIEIAPPLNPVLPSDASLPQGDIEPNTAYEAKRLLRHFAWWKEGADVSVAMRVAPESAHADDVVRTLRQWLKEAGMNLLSVIVNGKAKQ